MPRLSVCCCIFTGFLAAAPNLSAAALYNITTFLVPGASPPGFFGVTGVNNIGQIVGGFGGAGGRNTGYIRNPNGSFVTFSGPSGSDTYAGGINDVGQVILYTSSSGPPQNFLRSADGLTYMPINSAYPGDLYLSGLNNLGQIVGSLQTPGTPVLGYLLNSDGSASVFQYPGASNTFAVGINNLGVIAGWYRIDLENHGFLRNPDGSFVSFDVPELLSVLDINDLGEIVGSAGNQAYSRHGDGSIDFLSVPGQTLTSGTGINNSGEVVGLYQGPGTLFGGYFATPVPEPSTSVLWATVLAFAGAYQATRVPDRAGRWWRSGSRRRAANSVIWSKAVSSGVSRMA
jgi:hypothetical protein